MKFTVVTTEQAAQEIEDAFDWWARHRSAEQANRWYAGIRDAIASLATAPERCPVAPENEHFRYELRELHFGIGSPAHPTHRIIFAIVAKTVVVLTVRHAARRKLRPSDLT